MDSYFQTWTWNAKLRQKCKWCAVMWQWLCGLVGHEISQTEWGYGGGENADTWCRWCNKHMTIPKTELQFRINKKQREFLKSFNPSKNQGGK